MTHVFHFAIPRNATLASRQAAPAYIHSTFGIRGAISHVRSEPRYHLYAIEYTA